MVDLSSPKYSFGAFEATDMNDMLEAFESIEKLVEKIGKKASDLKKIPTKADENELQKAKKALLEKALAVVRRSQPDTAVDLGKATLSQEGLKASRDLFTFLDKRGETFDEEEFKRKVSVFERQCKADSVDFQAIQIDETPALPCELEDEDDDNDDASRDEDGIRFLAGPRNETDVTCRTVCNH
jgi:hypothetical protein